LLRNVEEVDIRHYYKLGIDKYKRLGVRCGMNKIESLPSQEVDKIAERLMGFGPEVGGCSP
jgi:hypothetical protein